jgi:hypothetical protein
MLGLRYQMSAPLQDDVGIQAGSLQCGERPFRMRHAIRRHGGPCHRNDPRQPGMASIPGQLESRHELQPAGTRSRLRKVTCPRIVSAINRRRVFSPRTWRYSAWSRRGARWRCGASRPLSVLRYRRGRSRSRRCAVERCRDRACRDCGACAPAAPQRQCPHWASRTRALRCVRRPAVASRWPGPRPIAM